MSRKLAVLMCALVLTGFATLATAAEPAPAPAAQPTIEPVFLSEAAFLQSLSGAQAPAPILMAGCQGGLNGPCDRNLDCKGYSCPLGEIRYCFGGTGSGCEGSCGCW